MKTFLKFIAAASFVAMAGSAFCQGSAHTTGNASGRVLCKVNIVTEHNLEFGTVVAGSGSAHVTSGGIETYVGNIKPGNQAGTHTAAQFHVTGESGFHYALTTSPASGNLVITDGHGHSTTVQLDGPVAQSGTLGHLSSTTSGGSEDDHHDDEHSADCGCNGSQVFNVGGVLTDSPALPSGYYRNTNSGGTAWIESVTYN